MASFALATQWWHVLLGRVGAWIGRGARSPVRKVLLAEATTPETYGRAFGLDRAMDSAGAVVGPLLAVVMKGLVAPGLAGLQWLFAFTFIPGSLAALSIAFLVREKPHQPKPHARLWKNLGALPRDFKEFLLGIGIAGLGDFSNTLLILWAIQAWRDATALRPPPRGRFCSTSATTSFTRSPATWPDCWPIALRSIGCWRLDIVWPRCRRWPYCCRAIRSLKFALVFGFSGVYMGLWETVESAAAATMLPAEIRGTGFGALETVSGLGDILSSVLIGWLWTVSRAGAMGFVIVASLTGRGDRGAYGEARAGGDEARRLKTQGRPSTLCLLRGRGRPSMGFFANMTAQVCRLKPAGCRFSSGSTFAKPIKYGSSQLIDPTVFPAFMSYNSFKRVLGETSLERKCRILFGVCLGVMITGSFWWYGSRTEELVYAQSRSNGQYLVDAVMLQRHWLKRNSGRPTLRHSSTAFIDRIAKNLQTHRDYKARILTPGADTRDKENGDKTVSTATEKAMLRILHVTSRRPSGDAEASDGTSPSIARKIALPTSREYRYFQPIRLRKDCIDCHQHSSQHMVLGHAGLPAPAPPVEGDLMAVVEVILPDAETQTALSRESGDLHRHRHRHRVHGDDRLVCHRALRDRQAAEAFARRQRRGQPRQYRGPGRNPHRATNSRSWASRSTKCSAISSPCKTNCARSTPISTARSTNWPRPTCGSTK